MRVRWSVIQKLGGLSLATVTARWMSTLEYRAAYYDPTVDPAHPQFRGPAIFLFWHEYIPFLFHLRGHCRVAMLLSQHQDAEWLAQAARHMGFGTIRGSTNRGGLAALRELFERGRVSNLTITPDGPRGPRRRMAPGAVFVASRLGIPLVPVGLAYERPWRLSTWDRFAVPRPGTRARGIAGPRMYVPADLDRAGIEAYRQYVEQVLNMLTCHAEHWADSGCRHVGEHVVRRQSAAASAQYDLPAAPTRLALAPANAAPPRAAA